MNLIQRPRRLRNGSVLRSMVRETRISADTLIYPMFVIEGTNIKEEIATMPGQYRWSIDRMDEILQELTDAGVKSVLLFGIPKKKDEIGSSAWAEDGIGIKSTLTGSVTQAESLANTLAEQLKQQVQAKKEAML